MIADRIRQPDTEGTKHSQAGAPARALVRGTGRLFQSTGIVVLVVSMAIFGVTGVLRRPVSVNAGQWLEYIHGDTLPAAVLAICTLSGVVGGMALATAGLGLAAERADAAWVSIIASLTLATIHFAAAAIFVVRGHQWIAALAALIVALIMLFLSRLGCRSLSVLRRFPPRPDRNVVTDEVLEKWRSDHSKRLDHESH